MAGTSQGQQDQRGWMCVGGAAAIRAIAFSWNEMEAMESLGQRSDMI